MNVNKLFPSKFLKAADLDGEDRKVTIDRMRLEAVERDGEQKPVLYFAGSDKGLVLNKTNALVLGSAFGDETDNWAGKRCILYVIKVQFEGKLTDGIRVRVPGNMRGADAKAPAAAVPWETAAEEFEATGDELPY